MKATEARTYVSTRFVDRLAELGLVQDIMRDLLKGHSVLKPVVNFHGVKGIGKTWLVQRLHGESLERGLPAVLVDLASLDQGLSMEQAATQVTESILEQAGRFMPKEFAEQFREAQGAPPQDLAIAIRTVLDQSASGSPILLLFDAAENVSGDVLAWLECELISPMIQTDRVVVVIAGRKKINWSDFEVGRRSRHEPLQPFDPKKVGAQIPSYAYLADQIAGLTDGHPLACEQVAESLREIEGSEATTLSLEDFKLYRRQLLKHLFDGLINGQIMRGIAPDVRQALRTTSILRHFDVNALRYLLVRFVPVEFDDKPAAYYLELIARMVDSGLVTWDSRQKGYALDRSIRRIMFLHRLHCDHHRFVEMNEAAAELYALWIEKLPENRVNSIVERLFHLASSMADTHNGNAAYPRTEAAFLLRRELENYLEKYYTSPDLGFMGMTALREELALDAEFSDLMPFEHHVLCEFISEFLEGFVKRHIASEGKE